MELRYLNTTIANDILNNHGTLGIKFPINGETNSHGSIFNMSYSTEDQALSNFINLLFTKDGERYMQPEFGVGIYYYLFEQLSEIVKINIESKIKSQTATWLPYIIIHKIAVIDLENPEGLANHIQIKIFFQITTSGANKEITVFKTSNNEVGFDVK